jgi:polysaccharide export outer membrane protein
MNPANSKMNSRLTRAVASQIHRSCLVFFALAAVLLALTGCRSSTIDPSAPPLLSDNPGSEKYSTNGQATSAALSKLYYPGIENYSTNDLHEGDVVRISFQYSTNFDAEQKVALDGTLNLNMVGRVMAAGKTMTQLQQDLTKDYQPFARGDIITVDLISSGAIVYVCGAVLRPGPLALDHPLTVLEAVMGSGGFDNTRAKLSNVTVLRIVDGSQEAYHINLNRILAGRDSTPFYLQPYDIIYVPAKVFNY